MNKDKQIKAMQTAKQILGFEPGIDRPRTTEESILANAYTSLAREVERDYVRKDSLFELIEKLSIYDTVPGVLFALCLKINSGELDGDS